MKAELKYLHSPEIFDLAHFEPKNRKSFSFLLQIMVGPKGEEGEESFEVEVCTPRWLASNFDEERVILGSSYLIVQGYSYEKLKEFIIKYLDHCTGDNWLEVARKVSRLGQWEFENYIFEK